MDDLKDKKPDSSHTFKEIKQAFAPKKTKTSNKILFKIRLR